MSKTRFQTEWCEIAARWGLRIETPFTINISSGTVIVPVLLRDFGAPKGMLLVTEYESIEPFVNELTALGYGFSCLSESTKPEAEDDSLQEMLEDWGWSGEGNPPRWFRGRP